MSTTSQLMTVEEFSKLPEDDGPVYHELRHGEIVPVTRAKAKHYQLQRKVRDLLQPLTPAGSLIDIELAFQPLPEYELRVADVAYVSPARWAALDLNSYFQGAPDLVIEILSPSNTAAEIHDKEQLCLENGTKEFWVLYDRLRQVKVSTPDGHAITYRSGQEIPLALFGGAKLAVDAIFGPVR